jgi:Zn-dependent peptidase ImmA (M78 family)
MNINDTIFSNYIASKIVNEQQLEIYRQFDCVLPFDVVGFGKALGIDMKESKDLPAKVSGFIKQIENQVSICVNKFDSLNRKRFTIAHELGHYFLHKDKLTDGIIDGVNTLNRDGTVDKIENEANDFAANLLMPEQVFKALWKREDYSVTNVAEYFLVSESAIVTRAKFLKLIQSDYYNYFC